MSARMFLNNKVAALSFLNNTTGLNPNAVEFIPSSVTSPIKNVESPRIDVPKISGKAVLDQSESNTSNNSDDEAHQYWRHQLPDDITPDFKASGDDELQVPLGLSFSELSISDVMESSQFGLAGANQFLTKQHGQLLGGDNVSLAENIGYSSLGYTGSPSSSAFTNLDSNPWDKQYVNGDHHVVNGNFIDDSNASFLHGFISDHAGLDNTSLNPVEFLASQFPCFAVDSLADVYYANGCDLNLTTEILTQLELQVDGGFNQNMNSKTFSAPSLDALDFPALPVPDAHSSLSKFTVEDLPQKSSAHQCIDKENFPFLNSSNPGTFRGATDFASAVRKLASQDSSNWKYERNGSAYTSIGSSRTSQPQGISYNGNGKKMYLDKLLHNSGTTRAAPVWLETGDAVGSIYLESREEARDYARIRNACFEQARQAYLIGNKALAKELSLKGQLYNMQMKAAHEKAGENIYRQRNPIGHDTGYSRGQDPLIDLHGLHVNEAIHVLKHELNILRKTARSAGQRLRVMICVGTGHHTKGSRTPARLPVAVEQYLMEEGLQFSEPQPGLLRVVIY